MLRWLAVTVAVMTMLGLVAFGQGTFFVWVDTEGTGLHVFDELVTTPDGQLALSANVNGYMHLEKAVYVFDWAGDGRVRHHWLRSDWGYFSMSSDVTPDVWCYKESVAAYSPSYTDYAEFAAGITGSAEFFTTGSETFFETESTPSGSGRADLSVHGSGYSIDSRVQFFGHAWATSDEFWNWFVHQSLGFVAATPNGETVVNYSGEVAGDESNAIQVYSDLYELPFSINAAIHDWFGTW